MLSNLNYRISLKEIQHLLGSNKRKTKSVHERIQNLQGSLKQVIEKHAFFTAQEELNQNSQLCIDEFRPTASKMNEAELIDILISF